MENLKYAVIDLNFDSLGYSYGFPLTYKDPSFFEVADRFFNISDDYKFKYSIYVIGKDLIKPQNEEQVKKWSRKHEIGNHSLSHCPHFASLSFKDMLNEVVLSHKLIKATTGKDPKGFIAPVWASSRRLTDILISENYLYDTSKFPSWLMFPLLIKYIFNHYGDKNLFKVLQRKDYLANLIGRRKAHDTHGIISLPLPTNKVRIACWHTLGFMFGWKFHNRLLKSCLNNSDTFYYLVHPTDLLDKKDLDKNRNCKFDRLSTPLKEKENQMRKSIEMILDSGRKIITMEEYAKKLQVFRCSFCKKEYSSENQLLNHFKKMNYDFAAIHKTIKNAN